MMDKVYIGLVLLIVGALAYATAYHDGKKAGRAECEAAHSKAAASAQIEQDRRATASATATTDMLDYLARNLPPIETTTHEAIERVRIVYRDHPVPAVCKWDDRVRDELEAARVRANTAGGQVRSAPAASRPAHP